MTFDLNRLKQSTIQGSKRPSSFKNWMKNEGCPSGVTAAPGSYSTCSLPSYVSTEIASDRIDLEEVDLNSLSVTV